MSQARTKRRGAQVFRIEKTWKSILIFCLFDYRRLCPWSVYGGSWFIKAFKMEIKYSWISVHSFSFLFLMLVRIVDPLPDSKNLYCSCLKAVEISFDKEFWLPKKRPDAFGDLILASARNEFSVISQNRLSVELSEISNLYGKPLRRHHQPSRLWWPVLWIFTSNNLSVEGQ